MNTYIVFRPKGVKKFAYCIAPCDEKYYRESAVEKVTEPVVEPFPLDGEEVVRPIAAGLRDDRDDAIHRARGAIEMDKLHDLDECRKRYEETTKMLARWRRSPTTT